MNLQEIKIMEKLAKDINQQFYRKRNPYGLNKSMKKVLNFPSNQKSAGINW